MSTFSRYAFAVLIALYGIYQMTNDHEVAGAIGIGLMALLLWFGRKT
jgi:hypothetical protein